jgi:hypothetical protein
MKRDASLRLTDSDKQAAKQAILGSHQGVVRDDGSL